MPFDLSIENRGAYLFLTPAGTITAEALIELGHSIRRACDDAGLEVVLLDCRSIEGALPTTTLFYATPRYLEAVGLRVRVAYINPPANWSADQDQFSRNVAFNRGGSLEVFGTEGEAVRWLTDHDHA